MSAIKQRNATNSFFHDSLKSVGVLDLRVIRAFCEHFAGPDHLLAAPRLVLALGHKHHYFPHLDAMVRDAASAVVHLPADRVDQGTLSSYLLEKRKNVQVVDLVANEPQLTLTLPVDVLPAELPAALTSDVLPVSALPRDAAVPESTVFRVSNKRELVSFTRPKFFRDWIALIRLLEGDPLEGLEVSLKEEKQVFEFNRQEKFVPAKPELFQLPPSHKAPVHVPSRETEVLDNRIVRDGEIQEEGINLLKRFKGRIARDDATARELLPQIEKPVKKPDGRANPDFPALADLPYDEGAQIDQTKLLDNEDTLAWKRTNAHRRDVNVLRVNAAKDNVKACSDYEDPTPFDFRPDLPARDREHGRRLYDPQTKPKRDVNEKISGFNYTAIEELERAEFLDERNHKRKFNNYKQYLPKSEMYDGRVVSQNFAESTAPMLLVMPRTAAGLNLYTRGLNAQQLEKRLPLAYFLLCQLNLVGALSFELYMT